MSHPRQIHRTKIDPRTRPDLWLRRPGRYVFEVRDFFRRPVSSGLNAIHASCYVLGEMDGPDITSSPSRGLKVCRPFVIEGKGLSWTVRFLAVCGNAEALVDLESDNEVSGAIAFHPFVGMVVEPDQTAGKPHRAIQIASFEHLDPAFEVGSGPWNGESICRDDPRV